MSGSYVQFQQPRDEGSRYYDINGEKLPSVTTILGLLDKKVLVPWGAKCVAEHVASRLSHDNVYTKSDIVQHLTECRNAWVWESDRATTIGTNVHEMTEGILKSDPVLSKQPICIEEENCLCAFYEFLNTYKVEALETETLVYNVGYAGRTDIVALVNGVKTLIDTKTSKAVYPEYRMQVAAYVNAYNRDKQPSDMVQKGAILRLDKKTGGFEYKEVRAIDKEYAKFLSLAAFYALYKDTHIERALALFDMASQAMAGITIKPREVKRASEREVVTKGCRDTTGTQRVLDLIESTARKSSDPCDPFL